MFRAMFIAVLFFHINFAGPKRESAFRNIPDCYVAINAEPLGYETGNWVMVKDTLTLDSVPYDRFKIFLNDKLWCVTYIRQGDYLNRVNVYASEESCEECLKAVEAQMTRTDTSCSIYFNNQD
jgi:hypothetical protein